MDLLSAIAWLHGTGQPCTDAALAAIVPRWQLAGLRQLCDSGDVVTCWPADWPSPGYRLSVALGGRPQLPEAPMAARVPKPRQKRPEVPRIPFPEEVVP